MLKLICGTAGTGRTGCLMDAIRRRAEQGRASIYLVPEQSSQTAEVRCFDALGDRLIRYCTPLSFRTLSRRIDAACGGMARPTLTDAGRCVFLRRALDSLDDQVKYYRRHRHNAAFLAECAGLVQRFKRAGADAASLYKVCENGAGGEKLSELALIYAAYEAALSGSAVDEEDKLLRSAGRLDGALFADTAVFIDDFDSFTAPELELLRRLLPRCEEMTVALCCDGLAETQDGLGFFSPVRDTAARLLRMAKEASVPAAAPQMLQPVRPAPAGLAALELLLRGEEPETDAADGLYYEYLPDRQAECRNTAAQIARLARQGVPYRDMAVICRDLAPYEDGLRAAFDLYDIPCHLDRSDTVEHTAPAAAVRAALDLAKNGLSGKALLALVKTDLCGVDVESAAALENYAFVWQPSAADWRAPFTLNPAGFGEMREEDAGQLALAEAARARLVPKTDAFLERVRRTDGRGLSRAVWLFLSDLGCPDRQAELCEQLRAAGHARAAQEALRSWDLVMEALDEMAALLDDDAITPAEYDDLLGVLLRAGKVGVVPQSQDAVVITSADRMRLSGVRRAFVLGVAEGEFPRTGLAADLLTQAELDFLAAGGIRMPGGFEEQSLREEMRLYRALTCPSEELYITVPAAAAGEAKMPAAAISGPISRLQPPACRLEEADYYATPKAALAGLAAHFTADTPLSASLRAALEKAGREKDCLRLDEAARPRDFAVEDRRAMERLLGRRLNLSPSRVESWYKCSYAYFLQHVLRLRPRRKAELSPAESGSFVHYILEHALRRCGENFAQQTEEQLMALAEELAEEYIKTTIPEQAAAGRRFRYLVDRIKQNAGKLLVFMQKEQAQSAFRPVAFELPVGEGEEVPPLRLVTPDGVPVLVRGTVDRVDVMHRDGEAWVRVVDYKTGAKEFSLDEVWCGLNLQMLLYLFSVCGAPEGRFAGAQPAGVLYLLADPNPPLLDRQAAAQARPAYTVDGLVLADEMIINAMDKEGAGVFIPVSRTVTGKLRKSTKLADLAKLGRIRRRIEELILQLAEDLYDGRVDAAPLVHGVSPCTYCDYRTVCRHETGKKERAVDVKNDIFDTELKHTEATDA